MLAVNRLTDISEQDLLVRLRNPDTAGLAFNQLVRTYQQPLYRVVRRMVIDHEEANDVLQEAFVKAWRNLDKFREDARLSTWLYRIATNEALTHLRKQKRRAALSLDTSNSRMMAKLDKGVQDGMVQGDDIQLLLQKIMLKLPERQRLVFQLRYYDDLSYDDISEMLGTSVGALKASYHHAVKKVERALGAH